MTRSLKWSLLAGGLLLTGGMPLLNAQDAPTPADAAITQHVKDTLAQKDPIIAPRVEVSTHAGVVTLSGIALTQQYILNALRDARSVDGVVKVENRLRLE